MEKHRKEEWEVNKTPCTILSKVNKCTNFLGHEGPAQGARGRAQEADGDGAGAAAQGPGGHHREVRSKVYKYHSPTL